MAITRIKTDQITDSAVTTGKIADDAITAAKLADSITYGSDLTISGNLTVSGTTVAVATTNTRVDDAIISLAQGTSGSPSEDAGILIDRGSSDNVAFLWDESADQFILNNVGSEDGDTAGNVTLGAYQNLQLGTLTFATLNDGTTAMTSTTAELNLIDGSGAGTIVNSKAVIYGSSGEVNATTLQIGGSSITSTAAELNLVDGITAGTAAASKAVILDGSKDIAGLNDVSAAGITLSDLTDNRVVIAGTSGILEDDANFTFDGTTFTVGGGDISVFSATVAGVGNFDGALTVDGLLSADGGLNTNDDFTVDTDGNVVAVGLVTTGVMDFNNTTEATSATTGAVQIAGGVGIAKDLWVGIDLDVVGATTLDGAVTLGNASGDAVTVTGTATFTPSADFDGGFTVAGSQTINMGANRVQAVADPTSAQDSATKAYVDSQVSSGSSLTIAADTGSNDTVTVGTDTLTFSGTSNEVNTAVTNNTITIGLPDDVTVGGVLTVTGNLVVNGTTTTLSSTNTVVEDTLIELNTGAGSNANDMGIIMERGSTGDNAIFMWDESADGFQVGTTTAVASATGNISVTDAPFAAAAITSSGVVTATGFTIGSAVINEAELETIDGITAGTAAASKAVVLGGFKDITGIGTVGCGAVTSTGVVTGTGFTIGSAVINEAELETIDGVTAGTVAASKAVVVDANKDIASFRNLGATGETTLGSAIVSDLTDNRIVIAGTSGALEDDANFTFDGTTFTVGGGDSTVFSATVAGVGNFDGALTVDGLASLDGGINTNDDFTVDVDGNVVAVGLVTTGVMDFNNTTTTTSATSGAVQVAGGVGVAENIYAGGTITATGQIHGDATTTSTSVTTGSGVFDGGLGVAENIFAGGFINTADDLRILADNKQLEIGAGTDFTIGHNATDTTIANATGILAINSAGGIRINEDSANVDVVIESNDNATMFMVDGSANNVGIGGAPSANAILDITGTGAMIIPVGTTAQRPTGETGQFRYNSTTNGLEFYDDAGWESLSTSFTLATSQTFTGDGSDLTFTLSALSGSDSYTTAGVFVSINGVVQQPTVVYGISGTTLTFTSGSAPANGDLIEVRKFTTTTTIKSLADGDGDTQVQVEESNDEDKVRIDAGGSEIAVIDSSGITLTTGSFVGTATQAQYADLAEKYASDEDIAAGSVVHFVGEGKVASCNAANCPVVAGVVSTDPAYLMNSKQDGVALALAGRVPTKVTGAVAAGDLMVSAGNGMAMANNDAKMGTVIGKAIEANEGGEGVIEVLVMMM